MNKNENAINSYEFVLRYRIEFENAHIYAPNEKNKQSEKKK